MPEYEKPYQRKATFIVAKPDGTFGIARYRECPDGLSWVENGLDEAERASFREYSQVIQQLW